MSGQLPGGETVTDSVLCGAVQWCRGEAGGTLCVRHGWCGGTSLTQAVLGVPSVAE